MKRPPLGKTDDGVRSEAARLKAMKPSHRSQAVKLGSPAPMPRTKPPAMRKPQSRKMRR